MKDINATVIVDLSGSLVEIFKNLQKDARWGVNKAKKENLKVELSNKEEDWTAFYDIYRKTMKIAGTKVETLSHIKERSKAFFVCKKNAEMIAGSCLDIVNGMPKLSRNASLKEYQKMQPNNLLYWEAIIWCKKKGYSKLDLGGWQINPSEQESGVNSFKERWGEVVFYYKDYPVPKALLRKIVRNVKLVRWLSKKIKKKM